MKYLAISLALLFILGCKEKNTITEHSNNNTKNIWKEIIIDDLDVQYLLPEDRFDISSDTLFVDWLGSVELETRRLIFEKPDSSGNWGYSFGHYKYPDHKFTKIEIPVFFDGIVDNLKDAFNAQIIYNRKVMYKSYPGREIYYLVPHDSLYFTERTYLINDEQYAMIVLTDKDHLLNSNIFKFLDSFSLME